MAKNNPKPAPKKTQAETICDSVSPDIREQAVTLAKAVLTMQAKIDQQIPVYEQMPLAQQVKVGTGEKMLRANPAVQEFRATVRDYAAALKNLQEILDDNSTTAEVTNLDSLRARFKVVS